MSDSLVVDNGLNHTSSPSANPNQPPQKSRSPSNHRFVPTAHQRPAFKPGNHHHSNHSHSSSPHHYNNPRPPRSSISSSKSPSVKSFNLWGPGGASGANSGIAAPSPTKARQAPGSATSVSSTGALEKRATALHPLRHVWTVSFVHRTPGQKVADDMWTVENIAEMGSIERFWNIWSHLKRPSALPMISEYYIFKSHINPTWEDPHNAKGGKWVVRLKKGLADRMWEELVMSLLGERLFSENDPDDASDDICGCVISARKEEDLLSVWHSDSSSEDKKARLQQAIRLCLGLHENTVLTYRANGDNLVEKGQVRRRDPSSKMSNNITSNPKSTPPL